MCQTEKERRLNNALIETLKNPKCYPNQYSIKRIEDIQISITDVYDNNGSAISDMSILEDAATGRFTGSVRITYAYNENDSHSAMSAIYKIETSSFIIKDYVNGTFLIDISIPIVLSQNAF